MSAGAPRYRVLGARLRENGPGSPLRAGASDRRPAA